MEAAVNAARQTFLDKKTDDGFRRMNISKSLKKADAKA
jgi:hypothetical protein